MKTCLSALSIVFILVSFTMEISAGDSPVLIQGKSLPLIYISDFTKGTEGWEFTDANAWKILPENGIPVLSLFQQSKFEPAVRSPLNQAIVKNLTVSDFVLEAEMKTTKEEYPHRDLCLFFGKQDPSHFYYVHIAPTSKDGDPNAHSVFLVDGKPRVSIALERIKEEKWSDTEYRKIRIVRDSTSGEILVYFVNLEKPAMKAIDKTFVTGKIGVGSFDDIGNVRSLKVWGNTVNK